MNKTPFQITRRKLLSTTTAAMTTTLATPGILRAQTVNTLTMSVWVPLQGDVAQNLFYPWAEGIEEITDGRVKIDILPSPMGPPPAHLELLRSGQLDVGFSIHGYSQGEFARAKIGQFSFLGDAYGASQAFSKVYGQLLRGSEEHTGITLLGLFQHGPGMLMLRDKVVRTAEDFQGLRVRTSGGYISGLMSDLGATNVPMSPTDARQALIDGTIDGVCFPFEGAKAFNIVDQITYVSEIPSGYYNATWFQGMSNAAAARLPAEDLALIRSYSNEMIPVLAAKAFDYADYIGKEQLIAAGIEIETAPQSVINAVKGVAANYESAWSAEMAAAGFEGERALAFTRRLTSGG
ncbi:TRAP transporter substrate-binding protein DctP [Yoonia maritima]|uniref:TRAP transporter substrate-binding protein DctP n=1 Tax=Yoonia maritima TaxID=1435347 RepID=UPI000D0E99AC|nr:TRAP transporter substrate-binding protein DctP [Yoonia maritima]